jgi:hypothetical protein
VAILARYGVKDIYRAMIEREDVVTLMVFNQLNAEYLQYGVRFARYIKEHYGYGITTRHEKFYWLNPPPAGQQPDAYRQYLRIQFEANYADTLKEDEEIRTLR